mmetsp:Transcript_31209/g.73242  ORF Transcript_31209/g.73242 Transcript_31209/m.73242 type:complete len:215 (+) Transcript_31209:488-1132(+)
MPNMEMPPKKEATEAEESMLLLLLVNGTPSKIIFSSSPPLSPSPSWTLLFQARSNASKSLLADMDESSQKDAGSSAVKVGEAGGEGTELVGVTWVCKSSSSSSLVVETVLDGTALLCSSRIKEATMRRRDDVFWTASGGGISSVEGATRRTKGGGTATRGRIMTGSGLDRAVDPTVVGALKVLIGTSIVGAAVVVGRQRLPLLPGKVVGWLCSQ